LIVAKLIESAKQKLDPESVLDLKNKVLGFTNLLKSEVQGQWVVIGGPGQGKTTVGQFLCQLFRVAILKDRPNIKRNVEVDRAISNFESQCQKETIDLPTVRRFPIRIILNDFKEISPHRSF
jgi:replication-associated recombination protein RarA